jgi:hypothetical protein
VPQRFGFSLIRAELISGFQGPFLPERSLAAICEFVRQPLSRIDDPSNAYFPRSSLVDSRHYLCHPASSLSALALPSDPQRGAMPLTPANVPVTLPSAIPLLKSRNSKTPLKPLSSSSPNCKSISLSRNQLLWSIKDYLRPAPPEKTRPPCGHRPNSLKPLNPRKLRRIASRV